ncbi:MAG: CBS domain-containing protein [Chloroflexaceae bacterium]|nr:CBS domain-containing protein [Chloroflexaceae bacterium]
MLQHPIMIEPHKRVTEAQRILVENGIYYLPVVGDGKRLLGMITPPRLSIAPERLASLDVWEITRYLNDLTVEKVMIKEPELQTINPDATLEDAAEKMIRTRVGGLVVTEQGIVRGLITDNDLLLELRKILGAAEPGWRVTVRVPSRKGEFVKLTKAIADRGWGIMAMGNVRAPRKENYWDVLFKIQGCTREELLDLITSIEGHELRDIRETKFYSSN